MIRVDDATAEDMARFYRGGSVSGDWFGFAAKEGRLVVAFGGLVQEDNGDWRAFLDLSNLARRPIALRYAVRLLKEANAKGIKRVLATCDSTIPRAHEFLKRLSFHETDEVYGGRKVYEWQA